MKTVFFLEKPYEAYRTAQNSTAAPTDMLYLCHAFEMHGK